MATMKVTKRSGSYEDMKFDKVTNRISKLMNGLSDNISADRVAQKVFASMYDGITTQEIDTLSAETCASMITQDIDYETLATRIIASNIQRIAPNNFKNAMKILYENNIISDETYKISSKVSKYIVSSRDNNFNYFGLKTLESKYLTRVNDKIIETPQYLLMRVSIGIHGEDTDKIVETYEHMSNGDFIHATPTLYNAGTKRPQMSSCFLVATKEDSISGIYDTLSECAQISKWAGGIGMHIHNVRSRDSKIRGTNGTSDGIIPMLRVFNATARYVNQAGKRKGSIAVYLEPWHADIEDFLELKLNQGAEEARTRDLFLSLWIPDLFYEKVKNNEDWCLFNPDECPGLCDVYGDEFVKLYNTYESEHKYVKKIKAQKLWKDIIKSQVETGVPNMLNKDQCNAKSNQKNIGIIKSSNLCTEIVEYSDDEETAVCNLASIALPKCIIDNKFNHEKLHSLAKVLTYNLNKIIDRNHYPVESAKKSNLRHRPIGIGVQGLADVFMMLDMPFDCEEAKKLNREIFETIYHGALEASHELAVIQGPYETFKGSPASEGVLQFHMWNNSYVSGMYDWEDLINKIKNDGIRNSLLVAPMPTASTSQILGNNECFEPYTSNLYVRRTLAGEFVIINHHLVNDLKKINLWSVEMKDLIIKANGSVQNILDIPENLKQKYKTVWEISQKVIIDMAKERGWFIDQSQSMNLYMESPTTSRISAMHMYAYDAKLKTCMYYLRSKPKSSPIKFTINPDTVCENCSG
jgi:ribonucleoside-diphosphate reductase alpha subunit